MKILELKSNWNEKFNSRSDLVEEIISNEDRSIDLIQFEEQRLKRMKKNSIRDMWGVIKHTNIHVMKQKEKREEIMVEILPNFIKDIYISR